MRVQEDLRSPSPLHSFNSSSGSGSKDASGNTNPGVSSAPRRFLLTGCIASSRATGVMSRPEVITTVSPRCADLHQFGEVSLGLEYGRSDLAHSSC